MTAIHTTTSSILSSFLPRVSAASISNTSRFTTLYSRQLSLPIIPTLAFAIPSAIHLNVPGLLEGLWESVLRAVPKKKTSHMKKRTRQMAGKGLKDVTALNRCSACGALKRSHLLCPYCVQQVKVMLKETLNPTKNPNVSLPNPDLEAKQAAFAKARMARKEQRAELASTKSQGVRKGQRAELKRNTGMKDEAEPESTL